MKKIYPLAVLITAIIIITRCSSQTPDQPADLVLLNGKILTMDTTRPEAEALAVRGDTILAVGSTHEIKKYLGPNTETIDLEKKLAVPGLIDGHGHYLSLGESLMGIDLRPARNWDEILEITAEAVNKASPGEWIVGRGWHQDKWDRPPSPQVEGLPLHHSLSEISPENPVMLIHVSGHAVFVNAAALDIAGIYVNTLDPLGGKIVRDSQGQPTGMLRETAQDGVREALNRYRARRSPEAIEAELRQQVQLAGAEAISKGITSFHDMEGTFAVIDLLKTMADEGNLPLRLYIAIEELSRDMESRLSDYRLIGYGQGFLTVRAIGEKVLDGALGTHGGWLLEPYADMPDSTGYNVVPVHEIQRSAELAIQHGFQMAIQGIGDRAARELLNIYEQAYSQSPNPKDLRWRIEHCQVIHPDDIHRFKQLGVIASVRGVFATSDGPWVVKRLGEKRTRERGYPYQTLMQAGVVVINGTDPPVEDIDPIANFYSSVTRKMADGSVFLPEQRMTRQQALESYTINSAYAAFEENIKGTLTPGKYADITVFSQDLMTVPDEEILNTKITHTIIAGKIKYIRDQ